MQKERHHGGDTVQVRMHYLLSSARPSGWRGGVARVQRQRKWCCEREGVVLSHLCRSISLERFLDSFLLLSQLPVATQFAPSGQVLARVGGSSRHGSLS